ncbi:MAG: hypothetical protein PHW02_00565 [bacterium]|nr:hypothetical protein [bacterium]
MRKNNLFFIMVLTSVVLFADSLNFVLIDTCITDADRLLDAECYGNLVYCADFSKDIRVFDASDANNLIEMGTISVTGYPQRFSLFGSYLHSANRDGGVCVLDLSEGTLPLIKASYNDGSRITGVWGDSQYVYAAGPDGLKLLAISDNTLILKDHIDTTSFTCNDVFVKDDIAYVCNWENGTALVDISDKNNLTVISTIPTSDYSCECYIRDTILYVAEYSSGVRCYNVSDGNNPVQIDSMPIGSAIEMQFDRNRLFVGNGEGIYAYYLNQNGSGTLVGFYTGLGECRGISIRNDTIFSCAEYAGMRIYEYSDPYSVKERENIKIKTIPEIFGIVKNKLQVVINKEGHFQIKIHDISGRKLFESEKYLMKGENYIEVGNLNIGTYLVTILGSDGQYFLKTLKMD